MLLLSTLASVVMHCKVYVLVGDDEGPGRRANNGREVKMLITMTVAFTEGCSVHQTYSTSCMTSAT